MMMKKNKFSNKLGHFLIIVGFLALNFKYGEFLLYETVYLLAGKNEVLIVKSTKVIDHKFVYCFAYVTEAGSCWLTSLPTKKILIDNEKISARIVPFFNVVLLGKFVIQSYCIGILIYFLCFAGSVLSILIILDINNVITRKFKKRLGGT